jgi:hypothetical protein
MPFISVCNSLGGELGLGGACPRTQRQMAAIMIPVLNDGKNRISTKKLAQARARLPVTTMRSDARAEAVAAVPASVREWDYDPRESG